MTPAEVLAVISAADRQRGEARADHATAENRQATADSLQAEADAWKALEVPIGTDIDTHQLLILASVSAAARAAELAAGWRELADRARTRAALRTVAE